MGDPKSIRIGALLGPTESMYAPLDDQSDAQLVSKDFEMHPNCHLRIQGGDEDQQIQIKNSATKGL